jgi:hypothetical protein
VRILAGAGDAGGARTLTGVISAANAIFTNFVTAGNTYSAQYWHRDVLSPGQGACLDAPGPGSDANFTNSLTFTATAF